MLFMCAFLLSVCVRIEKNPSLLSLFHALVHYIVLYDVSIVGESEIEILGYAAPQKSVSLTGTKQ